MCCADTDPATVPGPTALPTSHSPYCPSQKHPHPVGHIGTVIFFKHDMCATWKHNMHVLDSPGIEEELARRYRKSNRVRAPLTGNRHTEQSKAPIRFPHNGHPFLSVVVKHTLHTLATSAKALTNRSIVLGHASDQVLTDSMPFCFFLQ